MHKGKRWLAILLTVLVIGDWGQKSLVIGQGQDDALIAEAVQLELEEAKIPGAMGKDSIGNPVLIGPSATKVAEKYQEVVKEIDGITARSEEARLAAVSSVVNFTGVSDIAPQYQFTEQAQNEEGNPIEVYDVNTGLGIFRYWVDAKTNAVVQTGPMGEGWQPSTEYIYSMEELREQATTFLTEKNPCFTEVGALLEFSQNGKGELDKPPFSWFFRWASSSELNNSNVFVQVGLGVDGSLLSYTDTGICKVSGQSSSSYKLYLPLISK